jgi:hypothetical protein
VIFGIAGYVDEFEASEAMCCDKRRQVAENYASLIWKIIFMCQNPRPSLLSYFKIVF